MTKIEQYRTAAALEEALAHELRQEMSVGELVENNLRVLAIRKYREETNCSLKEARDFIEDLTERVKRHNKEKTK